MATAKSQIFQFRIALKGSKPPIWRRILVPGEYSFYDLHVAITSVMGWKDYHLHQFNIINPNTACRELISLSDEKSDFCGLETLCGKRVQISDYFRAPKDKAMYEYDFGDGWEHTVTLEKIAPAEEGERYPKCMAGKNAGPPEDCGGVCGYMELMDIIANPNHKEYQETMDWLKRMNWLGGDFNPTKFDPKAVIFADPEERWAIANRPQP